MIPSLKGVPPLRRLWAPSVLVASNPQPAGGKRSQPVRPAALLPDGSGSDCRRRLTRAGRAVMAGRSAARDRRASCEPWTAHRLSCSLDQHGPSMSAPLLADPSMPGSAVMGQMQRTPASARRSMGRSPSCRPLSTPGSAATMNSDPIKADGASAKPRSRPCLTSSRSPGKNDRCLIPSNTFNQPLGRHQMSDEV
jgi:hypothetical protein